MSAVNCPMLVLVTPVAQTELIDSWVLFVGFYFMLSHV